MLWGENRGISKWKGTASHQESNPGHLCLEPPVLCHWAMATGQLPTLTILYMYCTGGTECLSHTPGSHSVCAVRTPLGVDRKFSPSGKYPCWVLCVAVAEPEVHVLGSTPGGCRPFSFSPHNIPLFPAWGKMLWAFRVRKTTEHVYFPDGENFLVDP